MNAKRILTDLRGAAQLACDATIGVTDIVEQVYGTIARLPLPIGPMRKAPNAGPAKLVFGSIRGTTRLVDRTIGVAASPFTSLEAALPDSRERDKLVAGLNGVLGDHLARSDNPLAIDMALRVPAWVDLTKNAGPRRWLILAHGLCMSDQQWERGGHDHGAALAEELGFTPVYLRYNTGLGVAENGEAFAQCLEAFLDEHGGTSDEVALLAYSLGGLVSRSAVDIALRERYDWVNRLRKMVFIGTPHAGAPLAKGGQGVDQFLSISPYSSAFARLSRARSRGLHDLRNGLGTDFGDLPPEVATYAVAGALSKRAGGLGDGLLGDGLVSVNSALALGPGPGARSAFDAERQWVARGTGHIDLLKCPTVYQQLASWLNWRPNDDQR